MLSNINSLRKLQTMLVQSSLKNLRNDICSRWQVFICGSRSIYRTRVSPIAKQLQRLRTLFGWTSVFIFIHILDKMIQTVFLTLFGSWWQVVIVGTFFWTTSLWLLAVLEEKTSGRPWTIFRRDSK